MSDAPEAQPGDASSGRGVPCQNCGAPLVGEYCHQCGQRHVPDLRVLYLVRRFLESALDLEDLERGVGQTLRRAAQNPGRVARRYVDGERKEFVNPLGYFLLTATATFLVFSMFQEAWVQGQAEAFEATWRSLGTRPDEVFRSGSPLRSLGWSSAQDLAAGIFQFFQQVQTYVGLFTCIVAGLLLRWPFPERTAAETLVFELYVTAQATLFLGVLGPLLFWAAPAYIGVLPIFCRLASTPTAPGRFSERTGELASCPPVPIWQAGSYSSLVPVFSSSGPSAT
ncbi:hypothetical protein GGP72_002686 [Salinibacter ruber]|uniref:DUF3667 domain-containing protein n=1 Tax=Salinibacter ruber TaxID=146919 RepID=A0A9X2Q8Z0_9BACT|nr:DUF3667 domain-containing protein [Salinibacter ruber]MCS3678876.1 hypothetical protein [Salinibacter ruber]MCS3682032.1 hypothetical protein [Salinibacter ruber]